MVGITFPSGNNTMWNPSNGARKYFHSPHNQLSYVPGAEFTHCYRNNYGRSQAGLLISHHDNLSNFTEYPWQCIYILGTQEPWRWHAKSVHRTLQPFQQNSSLLGKKKQYHHLPSPQTLNRSLSMFQDNKKHVTPGALHGRTQDKSTFRVRGLPFTGLLKQCFEVIPHFYSQSVIDPYSFLHPEPV